MRARNAQKKTKAQGDLWDLSGTGKYSDQFKTMKIGKYHKNRGVFCNETHHKMLSSIHTLQESKHGFQIAYILIGNLFTVSIIFWHPCEP